MDIIIELRNAIYELNIRGLYSAAKWVSELLCSYHYKSEPYLSIFSDAESKHNNVKISKSTLTDKENLAKIYFDLKDYSRTINTLKNIHTNYSIFLRNYSKYLKGEKNKTEKQFNLLHSKEGINMSNKELKNIKNELSLYYEKNKLDAFGLYLLGMVLTKLGNKKSGKEKLIKSTHLFPLNYSAWQVLITVLDDHNLEKFKLCNHWVTDFFRIDLQIKLKRNDKKTETYFKKIEKIFPKNNYLKLQKAKLAYVLRFFDEAHEMFEKIRSNNPYNIDYMDLYSSVLFVKECKNELSLLAHEAMEKYKYRPETAFIVGNYYSLNREHHQAIKYFLRSLILRPEYIDAYILLGHEYVEIKNIEKAVESYKLALEIDKKDYRAWYGLGQIYEITSNVSLSLYYFGKATEYNYHDYRMWNAIGYSYERLKEDENAIKCYLKAEKIGDEENISVIKLAKIYRKINKIDLAFIYYKKVIEKHTDHNNIERNNNGSKDIIEAYSYIIEESIKNKNWKYAKDCCLNLMMIGRIEKKQSELLLKKIIKESENNDKMKDDAIE